MGIQRNSYEAAFRALRLWAAGLNVAPESAPKFYSGSGAPTAADPNGSGYLRTDGAANTTLYVMVSSSWVALTSDAAADAIADTNTYYTTDTIDGAFDALGVQLGGDTDATYNFTEANVCTDDTSVYANLEALDLKWGAFHPTQIVSTTLAVGAEATNVIAVTINVVSLDGTAVARAQRLICSLYEATMIEAVAAAFTMAETGAGTEISTTLNARQIIDTDANGDAIMSITDVAGASGKTMYLVVQPAPVSGTNTYGAPSLAVVTFD